MMDLQRNFAPHGACGPSLRMLRKGGVLALGSAGGRLDVVRGVVWLTRSGDPEDHLLGVGQSLRLPPSGRVLVEAWRDAPALVAWKPATWADRAGAAVRAAFGRWREIADPARRTGVGVYAAVVATVAGAALFGALSESRIRSLPGQAVLHNGAGARVSIGVDAGTPSGPSDDVSSAHPRQRARVAAQEARRRPAGPA